MLSVFTRVGKDPFNCIDDLAMCLAAQTCTEFEWIVILRPSAHELQQRFHESLGAYPALRDRTLVLFGDTDNRSSLLNSCLANSSGEAFVVVDDDDLVQSNFVEVFETALRGSKYFSKPVIFRTVPALQINIMWDQGEKNTYLPKLPIEFPWPEEFSKIDHFEFNRTPCLNLLFPKSSMLDLGIHWDETLVVAEDWDLLMRAVRHFDVIQLSETTGLYRRREREFRSKIEATTTDWKDSERIVRSKNNSVLDTVQFNVDKEVIFLSKKLVKTYIHTNVRKVYHKMARFRGIRKFRSTSSIIKCISWLKQ